MTPISKLQKLLSYLFPINLKKVDSEVSGTLEINLVKGQKVLDTGISNYSYGLLQKVLREGLESIHFDKKTKTILVLGTGAGSIVATVRDHFQSAAKMTLVDIDPEIIRLAKNEFEIEKYKNIEIVQSDALTYVQSTEQTFDLIIVDVFVDAIIPEEIACADFVHQVVKLLNDSGKIIFNTLRDTLKKPAFFELALAFEYNGISTKACHIKGTSNYLILGNKQADIPVVL